MEPTYAPLVKVDISIKTREIQIKLKTRISSILLLLYYKNISLSTIYFTILNNFMLSTSIYCSTTFI